MTPIVYGLLSYSAMLEVERGEIIRGGCIVDPDSPSWGCRACDDNDSDGLPSFMCGQR